MRAGAGWIAGVWRLRAVRRRPGRHVETAARGRGESSRRPRRATTQRPVQSSPVYPHTPMRGELTTGNNMSSPLDLHDVGGLDLAEEEAAVTPAPLPVLQQAARGARDARVVAPPPVAHGGAHLVDVVVLAAAVVGPLGAQFELPTLLLGLRHGDEVGAGAARLDDLIGDAIVGELEVLTRLEERRVDDRVVDDELTHAAPSTVLRPCAPGRRLAKLRGTPTKSIG